jgi:hypothetical protein
VMYLSITAWTRSYHLFALGNGVHYHTGEVMDSLPNSFYLHK